MGYDFEEMECRIISKILLIFFCNFNNFMGIFILKVEFLDFCNMVFDKIIIFFDEVYYDYIIEFNYFLMISLVKQGKNVIVFCIFFKVYGLVGLCVGYLVVCLDIVQCICVNVMVKVNIMVVIGVIVVMEDDVFYEMSF